MSLIDELYLPARKYADDTELDAWVMAQLPPSPAAGEGPAQPGLRLELGEGPPGEVPAFGAPLPPPEGALPVPPLPPQAITPPLTPGAPPYQPGRTIAAIPAEERAPTAAAPVVEAGRLVGGALTDVLRNSLRAIEAAQAAVVGPPGASLPVMGGGPGGRAQVPRVQASRLVPEVPRAGSLPLDMARDLLGFATTIAAASAAGAGNVAAGMLADFVQAQGQPGRLTDLALQVAPGLKDTPLLGPLVTFLASQPGDTAAEAGLKSAVEGVLAGGLVSVGGRALFHPRETASQVTEAFRQLRDHPRLQQAIQPLRGEAGAIGRPGAEGPEEFIWVFRGTGTERHQGQAADAWYVAQDPATAANYAGPRGSRGSLEALRIRRADLQVSPELAAKGVTDPLQALALNDAIIPPSAVQERLLIPHPNRFDAELANAEALIAEARAARAQPRVAEVPVVELHLAPERFQYKLQQGEGGATGSLAGVQTYDPNLAGMILVWQDPADGLTYVVNGHNRVGLAQRQGVESVAVRYLDAATAEEARTIGALANIAEGRGNAIDAAKLIRDIGLTTADLQARGIPLRERIAADGLALANLADSLFQDVIQGTLPLERGIIIGSKIADPDQQIKLVQLLQGKRVNVDMVRELADFVRDAPSAQVTQETLFGAEELTVSLALDKARIAAAIRERMATDKTLFAKVSKESAAQRLTEAGNIINIAESERIAQESAQLLEIFDRLKNRTGPISSILNEAAEELRAGGNVRDIQQRTYQRLTEAIPEALTGAEATGPLRAAPGVSAGEYTTSTGDTLGVEAERTRGTVSAAGVPIRERAPEPRVSAPALHPLEQQLATAFPLSDQPPARGFLTSTGQFLDVSPGEALGTLGHQAAVRSALDATEGQRLQDFLQATGAMRTRIEGRELLIEFTHPPSPAQLATLERQAPAFERLRVDWTNPTTDETFSAEGLAGLRQLAGEAGPPAAPPGPPTPPAPPTGGEPPGPPPRDYLGEAFESPGRFNPVYQAGRKLSQLTAEINVHARDIGLMSEATRGTITHAETLASARELIRTGRMSAQRVLALTPGSILTAEEGTAARLIRDATIARWDQIQRLAQAGDETAKGQLVSATALASQIEARVEAASGTEPARALSARRIVSRPRGVPMSQMQDLLRQLAAGPLSPEAEQAIDRAAAAVRQVVRSTREGASGPAQTVLAGIEAEMQAAAELPPGQALAGLWDILLRGSVRAEQAGIDPNLLQQILTRTMDAINTAVPEGQLLGGLWETIARGNVARQIAEDERSLDPNTLMAFLSQVVGQEAQQAFLNYYAQTSVPKRLVNALLEARQAGLLGIKSLERNMLGNVATTVWAVPERLAAGLVGSAHGGERVYAHEALDLLHGYWAGLRQAFEMAGQTLKTGESQVFPEANKWEGSMLPAISGDALGVTGPAGTAIDVLGEIIRWPFRGLAAGDDFFKWLDYSGQKYALAYRDYRQRLASGATPEQAQAAYDAALRQPKAWLHEQAKQFSLYTTFNDEVLNKYGQKLLELRDDDGPAGWITKFIIPYARTPMNVLGYGSERTPGLNLLSSHFRQEMQAGGARRDQALGQLALGSAAFTVAVGLAASGQITGRGPSDPKLRKQYEDNGWQPYSAVWPTGRPLPFRGFEPLSQFLAQAADFHELMSRGASYWDLLDLSTAMVLSSTEYMGEQPMVQGLSEVFKGLRDADQSASNILQRQLASLFPLPGVESLAKTAVELTDPSKRETGGPHGGYTPLGKEVARLWDEFAARTPGLSNDQFPMRDRLYGYPLLRQGGGWVFSPAAPSAQAPDPVRTELNAHGIAIDKVPKSLASGRLARGRLDPQGLEFEPIALTDQEWDRWQELSGTIRVEPDPRRPSSSRLVTLQDYLTSYLQTREYAELSDGPDGGKAREIRRVVRLYREEAKQQMIEESGRLPGLLAQHEELRQFKRLDKPEQARERPRLERELGRSLSR